MDKGYNPFSLEGKTVFVTGASSGIGQAIALACSRMGARVVITGRDTARLQATYDMLERRDEPVSNEELDTDSHIQLVGDLTDEISLRQIVTELPKLDGVAFCAGTLSSVLTDAVTMAEAKALFDVNYFSTIELAANLRASKKIKKGASLVFISSIAADSNAEPGNALYGATKAAIKSYSRVMASELSRRKIRVNSVSPGIVRTPLLKKFAADEEEMLEDEKKYPLGFGTPDDVANAVVYLLSDASAWMTGSDIKIDGGRTLR